VRYALIAAFVVAMCNACATETGNPGPGTSPSSWVQPSADTVSGSDTNTQQQADQAPKADVAKVISCKEEYAKYAGLECIRQGASGIKDTVVINPVFSPKLHECVAVSVRLKTAKVIAEPNPPANPYLQWSAMPIGYDEPDAIVKFSCDPNKGQ
jgi:hypothetical protein